MRPLSLLALAALVLLGQALGPQPSANSADSDSTAHADGDGMCRVVKFDMVPADDLQMVVWLEDDVGNYVDTLYITRMVGSYGLGNRPGMMEFNTAWAWPYGRRTSTFPVWAHRHGMDWPLLEFQNGDDTNLSHPLGQSSVESFFCRPLREGEAAWDTQTCASTIYTDKGVFSATERSLYPPRADLTAVDGIDSDSVAMFADMNPFDEVSRATPPGGMPFQLSWPIPASLPEGNYVAWIEVNRELDQNATYDYPEPIGIPWSEYGVAYRGQPSVVYKVPITIGATDSVTSALSYAGYGDPEGLSGMLFEPDGSITEGVSGSGASRLLLVEDGGEMYRVRVAARPVFDDMPPAIASDMTVVEVSATEMMVSFVAPSDGDTTGPVAGYEIRMLVGEEMTLDNWADATTVGVVVTPAAPGTVQSFTVEGLQPRTNYYLGLRAYDDCGNRGELSVVHALTPLREPGRVDACFVATAAYGSMLDQDVTMLRSFRDRVLRKTVVGELLVEGYYTFGPALAQLIAPSDTARRAARAGLAPIVDRVSEAFAAAVGELAARDAR
jgi:hypothetical protein